MLFYVEEVVVLLAFLDKDAATRENVLCSETAIFANFGLVHRDGVLLQLTADFTLGCKHARLNSQVDKRLAFFKGCHQKDFPELHIRCTCCNGFQD